MKIEITHFGEHDYFKGNGGDAFWYQFCSNHPINTRRLLPASVLENAFNYESTPAPETCSCGVPYKIHSSCCGWQNARPIIFGCETRVNPTMTPEETELRWLISQSPNADKIAEQLFTNKIAL